MQNAIMIAPNMARRGLPFSSLPVILRAMTRTPLIATAALAISAAVYSTRAQTNVATATVATAPAAGNPPAAVTVALREQWRSSCIAGRRAICGKILRVFPDGLLIESGYTNLLRQPLTKSWLVPRSVIASRAPNLVESREPGAICVGTVMLTDLPRGKPHPYDYVILTGYPAGEFTYLSVGTIQKTVRRFSASLGQAVKANLAAAEQAAK